MKELGFSITDNFKMGKYEILIKDVTKGITKKMNDLKVELTIIDPEELAA